MANLLIDAMNDDQQWHAFMPDGVTPSDRLNITTDTTVYRMGIDNASGKISGSPEALNHTLQRSINPIDVSGYSEIRFWVKSSNRADGSPGFPFFLEIRFGSLAVPLDDVSNTWYAYIPVINYPNKWELIRLSLNGMDPAVRSGINQIQIRCVQNTVSFILHIDYMIAVREEIIADVDTVLIQIFHNTVDVGGTPVPAYFAHDENPPKVKHPYIFITHYDIQYNTANRSGVQQRSNFTQEGMLLNPLVYSFDLFYTIDAFADSREEKVKIFQYILNVFTPQMELPVNGYLFPVHIIKPDPETIVERSITSRTPLYFMIQTQLSAGQPVPVKKPFDQVSMEVGYQL